MKRVERRGGVDLQLLMPKPLRERVLDCDFWKRNCVAVPLDVALVNARRELTYVGGTFGGNQKATPFLCMLLKLLQLGPTLEQLRPELSLSSPNKYVTALFLVYVRLAMPSADVYPALETHLLEYRKLRYRTIDGSFCLLRMDELAERLLTEQSLFQLPLPHITKREHLVQQGLLLPRSSPLLDELLSPDDVSKDIPSSDNSDKDEDTL